MKTATKSIVENVNAGVIRISSEWNNLYACKWSPRTVDSSETIWYDRPINKDSRETRIDQQAEVRRRTSKRPRSKITFMLTQPSIVNSFFFEHLTGTDTSFIFPVELAFCIYTCLLLETCSISNYTRETARFILQKK